MNEPVNSAPMRMFYIDDSGAESTGYVVYSWIETSPERWSAGLAELLECRRNLYVKHRIPPATELHATKLTAGRGTPSTDPAFNMSKLLRREAVQEALSTVGRCGALKVGTVYRQTSARRRLYQDEREAVYSELIAELDTQLVDRGQWGMVFMDGDGRDPSYNRAHRQLKLKTRHLIEDASFQSSTASQWIQMADLVAWTAYQGLLRHPGKQWAWSWYDTYLASCDINGGPVQL